MATGETGFDDVTFDLISLQYHSLKAGHDYGQYVRGARNAGKDDIASFFEEVMEQDSKRAQQCHDFLPSSGGPTTPPRRAAEPAAGRAGAPANAWLDPSAPGPTRRRSPPDAGRIAARVG